MKHDLQTSAEALRVSLDDASADRLEAFERLLVEKAAALGLVAASDRGRMRQRHILDSLRAVAALQGGEEVYDLGSGAGLPGIVIAVALPGVRMTLVERQARRVAFLELTIDELGLRNAAVLRSRVEDVATPADACVARAFAPVARAWALACPILRPRGRLIFFAGQTFEPADVPFGAGFEVLDAPPLLESSGPLVIMTRQ